MQTGLAFGHGLNDSRRESTHRSTILALDSQLSTLLKLGSSGLSVLWHGKWRLIGANYVPPTGCVEPLPSSPSHRPFALSLRVDARAETARGGPLLLLFERRSSWSEISGFSHDNTLQPDEPNLIRLSCFGFRNSKNLPKQQGEAAWQRRESVPAI